MNASLFHIPANSGSDFISIIPLRLIKHILRNFVNMDLLSYSRGFLFKVINEIDLAV